MQQSADHIFVTQAAKSNSQRYIIEVAGFSIYTSFLSIIWQRWEYYERVLDALNLIPITTSKECIFKSVSMAKSLIIIGVKVEMSYVTDMLDITLLSRYEAVVNKCDIAQLAAFSPVMLYVFMSFS